MPFNSLESDFLKVKLVRLLSNEFSRFKFSFKICFVFLKSSVASFSSNFNDEFIVTMFLEILFILFSSVFFKNNVNNISININKPHNKLMIFKIFYLLKSLS